jgi:hypothetical protein
MTRADAIGSASICGVKASALPGGVRELSP